MRLRVTAAMISATTLCAASGAQPLSLKASPRFVYSPRINYFAYNPLPVSRSVLVADVDNGDGPDIIVVGNNIFVTIVTVLLNGGHSSFRGTDVAFAGPGFISGGALCDCDGDGDQDLAVAYENQGRCVFLINDGSGTFVPEAPETRLPGTMPVRSIAAADFNGDGWGDVFLGMSPFAGQPLKALPTAMLSGSRTPTSLRRPSPSTTNCTPPTSTPTETRT